MYQKIKKQIEFDMLVLISALVIAAVLAFLCVMRYLSYNAGMFDLGNMSQAIWSASHGNALIFSHQWDSVSRLALHVELVYFLLVPFYSLFPSPITLLILQSIIFVSGAFPLFSMANRRLENSKVARLIALTYLLYPVGLSAVLFDFHGDTIAMPLILFAINSLDQRKYRGYLFWLLLALSCKFYVGIPVAVMGLILFLKGDRRIGLITFIGAGIYCILAYFVIRPYFYNPEIFQPQFSTVGYFEFYFGRVADLLNVSDVLTRLAVLFVVLFPALWVGIRAVEWLIPALLIAIPSAISLGEQVSSFNFRYHHYAIAVPFLLVSIVYGASKLKQRHLNTLSHPLGEQWQRQISMSFTITVLFVIILIDVPLNPLFWISPPGWGMSSIAYGRTPRDKFKDQWLENHIPPNASVLSNWYIAPHLTNREEVHLFENLEHPLAQERLRKIDLAIADAFFDYYVPDIQSNKNSQIGVPPITYKIGIGHPTSSIGGVFYDANAIETLLKDSSFGLVEMHDGLLLFQRNPDSFQILDQHINKSTVQILPEIIYDFENGLGLVDVEIKPMTGRRYKLRFEWYVTTGWEKGRSLVAMSQLESVKNSRLPHLPSMVLYPTQKWTSNELLTFTKVC